MKMKILINNLYRNKKIKLFFKIQNSKSINNICICRKDFLDFVKNEILDFFTIGRNIYIRKNDKIFSGNKKEFFTYFEIREGLKL